MNRFLSLLLSFVLISCAGPRYPVLVDPTDPPKPVNPPVVEPTPAPEDAIHWGRFDSFKVGTTRLEEVHYLVGKGSMPDGSMDTDEVLWYWYPTARADGSLGLTLLGFKKKADGWVLEWKHVGY